MDDTTIMARPYPHATKLLGIVVLLVAVLAVVSNVTYPRQTDFIAYWAASVLSLHHQAAAAYDPAAIAAAEHAGAAFATSLPFGYPPPFLLVMLPFGLLPYAAATGAFVCATAAAYLAATARLWRGSAWLALAFPPVAVNAIIGQNGLLTAALMIGAAIALPRRPLLAGLLAGCLVIKPQLAILVPLAFAAGGQWRAFAGAALSSLGLSALALICFGPGIYVAFAHAMPLFASVVSSGLTGWYKMASVYAALRIAGLDAQAAWAVHGAVALAAAAMVAIVWRGRHDLSAKMAVLVAAAMLVSPYLYIYDTVALVVPFFWLAMHGADRRVLAILWLLPIFSVAQNWGFDRSINPMPLVPIGLLTLIGVRLFGRRTVAAIPRPAPASGLNNPC